MQEASSKQELIESQDHEVIDRAERFLEKYQKLSRLNGDTNNAVREAQDILIGLEKILTDDESQINKEELRRIADVIEELEFMQDYNFTISVNLVNLSHLVSVCEDRIREKHILLKDEE